MKTFNQKFKARKGYDQTVGLFYNGTYVGKCINPDCHSGNLTAQALEFLSMCETTEKAYVKAQIKKEFKQTVR